ncbi:MAG: sorbosone dehydrogenase family protein [Chitinophagaceae bacterium]
MKSILLLLTVSVVFMFTLRAQKDTLPPPHATKSSMNFSNVVGWANGETPLAPAGFTVTLYAEGFDNPRWLYQTPNGDVLVAESNGKHSLLQRIGAPLVGANKANNLHKSANRITILRDADHDGKPEIRQPFINKGALDAPFGMLVLGNYLYVANQNALMRFPYQHGDLEMTATADKVIELPAGKVNRHWTKNIITNRDSSKIYIAVGSGDNAGEKGLDKEINRACILEINPDGTGLRTYASGLRNPVGMGWAPGTSTLYTSVNERDELGDDLVPDYFTSVQENGFYGWPYSYFGDHVDPRVKEKRPDLVKKAIVPEVPLGSHTASLGLAFYTATAFPEKYHNGAFIAQHGSWNRSVLSGYKVVFIPFKNGKPAGHPEDFLTGFVKDLDHEKVRGRPVCVLMLHDGSLLVTDDKSNKIWRVMYQQ